MSQTYAHLGGYFTFDVAVGPRYTDEGVCSGVDDYGLLRLQFGLDGGVGRMIIFCPSSLQWPDEEHQYEPAIRVVADKREGYET